MKIIHIEKVEANCTKRTLTTTIAGLELAFYGRNLRFGRQERQQENERTRMAAEGVPGWLRKSQLGEKKKYPVLRSGLKAYAHKRKTKRENVSFMTDNELSVCASVKVHIIKIKSFHFSFVSASDKDESSFESEKMSGKIM